MRTVLPRSARRMKNSRPWKVGTRRSDSPWRMSSGVLTRFADMTAGERREGAAAWTAPALGGGEVGCAVHVAVRPVAEMLVDRVQELRAVACRSTILRLQHDVSQAGDQT